MFASPWWDDFPRMVDSASVATVSNYHGSFAMNGNGNDPAWGTFFQADQIRLRTANIAAFQNAGLKQIYYSETYGQSVALVAELGAWDETNPTPILHHFWNWNWQNYGGGSIRWLGAKNFFDNEVYARPFTRAHSRYGGSPMTYPDGTEATGYGGADTDPRNSRVYDAACAKNLLGELAVEYGYPAAGAPTNGLVEGAGHMSFGKDAACPLWTNYTYASTLLAADAGVDGMWTDNYGPWDSLGFNVNKHAFGDWSVARFRTYLADHFTWLELIDLGASRGSRVAIVADTDPDFLRFFFSINNSNFLVFLYLLYDIDLSSFPWIIYVRISECFLNFFFRDISFPHSFFGMSC